MILQYLAFAPDVAVGATLPSLSYTTEAIAPADAFVAVYVEADGKFYAIDTTTNPNSSFRFNWKTGAGVVGDYQVRCDVNQEPTGGYPIAGGIVNLTANSPVGTWLSCSTGRQWGFQRVTSTPGQDTGIVTISIRSAIDNRVLATGTYTLTAKVV